MEDVLGYAGAKVVVTGCASGMGAATAEILLSLGAVVVGLDVQETSVPVHQFVSVDLRQQSSIDKAVAAIGSDVASVASVAGLPGHPFSDLDTVLVNFVGARHLIESLLPAMAPGGSVCCVASNAGLGWEDAMDWLQPAIATEDFAAAQTYFAENPKLIRGGYVQSKQLLNAWVAWRGVQLIAERGIRLNCTNPGPTDTAMMPAFEALAGKEMIDAFVGPSGRRSNAVEQAWPVVFLNSPRNSYIAAEALHTDGGFRAAQTTHQLEGLSK